MTAVEIPDSVRREDAKAFTKQIGLDPSTVRSLEIVVDGLWVTIFARDANGRVALTDGDAACHRLFIPFDREVGQP
ncbi:hypothetical protein [Streptomyces sp. 1222.5]|uniref:hypothetical protein n=1 Tax=Streptomyces sp. 1222.5 TaxID=1881026 RepID=UPI003D73869F